jgi:hypothetical protein
MPAVALRQLAQELDHCALVRSGERGQRVAGDLARHLHRRVGSGAAPLAEGDGAAAVARVGGTGSRRKKPTRVSDDNLIHRRVLPGGARRHLKVRRQSDEL